MTESARRANYAFGAMERVSSATNFDLPSRMQASQNPRLNNESSFQFGETNTPSYNPLDNSRSTDDFQGKVESILREWINMCYNHTVTRDLQASFAQVIS